MKKILLFAALCAIAACQTNPVSDTGKQQTNQSETLAQQSETPTPATTQTDTLCFESKAGKDVFSLQLITSGNEISGTLDYVYHEQDGAHGTLKGTATGNLIVADYNYTIEGSEQIEVMEFKLENDKISRKRGELIEKDGKLMLKDPENTPYTEIFTKIDCSK